MRRKSIGATSQAFHEPMSTRAFLEFLTRLGCRDAGLRGLLARSPKPCPAQPRLLWLGSQPSGGIQAPEPVGQVSRGLGARAPRAWGPARQGPGPFSHKPLKLRFFAKVLVGAWRRRGCRLKRLLRRWGPGGKRSRDIPPTPPPPSPNPAAFWGCKGERKRVFTLSAFGNHPTRPPRSADKP